MIKYILTIHILSILNVVSTLIFNNWKNVYISLNNISKLEKEEEIKEEKIFKMWIIAIQSRYIISDLLYFYKVKNRYIFNHFLESIICAIVFYHSKNFTFSYICFMWAVFWKIGLYFKLKKKLFLKN